MHNVSRASAYVVRTKSEAATTLDAVPAVPVTLRYAEDEYDTRRSQHFIHPPDVN